MTTTNAVTESNRAGYSIGDPHPAVDPAAAELELGRALYHGPNRGCCLSASQARALGAYVRSLPTPAQPVATPDRAPAVAQPIRPSASWVEDLAIAASVLPAPRPDQIPGAAELVFVEQALPALLNVEPSGQAREVDDGALAIRQRFERDQQRSREHAQVSAERGPEAAAAWLETAQAMPWSPLPAKDQARAIWRRCAAEVLASVGRAVVELGAFPELGKIYSQRLRDARARSVSSWAHSTNANPALSQQRRPEPPAPDLRMVLAAAPVPAGQLQDLLRDLGYLPTVRVRG